MITMEEMCAAHLTNVGKAIEDLVKQKASIDSEISKLQSYLDEGRKLLQTEQEAQS